MMAEPQAAPVEDQAPDLDAPEDAAPDLTHGYCIEVSALPDGTFKVSGPGPLKEETGEYGDSADASSVGEALKAVLAIVKANPVGDSEQAQFSAGYGGG